MKLFDDLDDPDFKFWPGVGGGGEPPSENAEVRDAKAKSSLIDFVLLGALSAGCLFAFLYLVVQFFT